MFSTCEQLSHISVLVVGDAMLDRYLEGPVRRISPEAPVPVVNLQREWACPGGAGNVAASIAGLGAKVTFAGLVGCDSAGDVLIERLAELKVADVQLLRNSYLQTVTKTRLLAPDHHQLVRFDVDGRYEDFERAAADLVDLAVPIVRDHQVICLADYDKGTLSPALIRALIQEARRHGVPCLVDPKKVDFLVYAGATMLTPNVHEAERALGRPLSCTADVAIAAAELREQLGLDWMLITRGADGMTLAGSDGVQHFPAEVRDIADPAGAGDTVVAALSVGLGSGWSMPDACRLASVAAGVAVTKPGVYVVQAGELERAWAGASTKIVDWGTGRARLQEIQKAGRIVVFTNGCFDILHAGHLYCLEKARQQGDFLVIGLNSDVSVKLNKGEARPIISEMNRAALLAGLACVDMIVLFDETTPELLVRHLAPDVMVKGSDYNVDAIAGADFVRAGGGRVVTIPLLPGLSTTAILKSGSELRT